MSGNFHEVIPGEFYRSGQPTPSEIEDYAKRYNIKTIVNLRGASDSSWYDQEIKMSEELVAVLKGAPKPILIHCQAGADSSGLASVIYLQQIPKTSKENAEEQLWPVLYGHVGIPYITGTYAMDRSGQVFEKAMHISG